MAFDWNEFLSLAQQLARSTDEASKRTAISRAYYCVFNVANARAELTVGPRPWGEQSSHQWCWHQYRETPNRACARLGNTGERLKRMRVEADYNPIVRPRLDDEVRRILAEAHQFLADLGRLDSRYPRPQAGGRR